MNAINRDALIAKITQLPDERVAEIETFVDFIRSQEAHRELVRDWARASEPSFARVWDNPEDDVYNDL